MRSSVAIRPCDLVLPVLLAGCGGAPAPSTRADPPALWARIEIAAVPARSDGSPLSHARATLYAGEDHVEARVDLSEVGVDASSCAATEAPSDDALGQDDREDVRGVAIGCSGIDTGYRVALIDRGDRVEVWTLLTDEDPGTWQLAGELAHDPTASVRLVDARSVE